MLCYLRSVRKALGFTQREVAQRLGVSKAHISKIESGKLRVSDYWLDQFASLYQCSVHDLIDDDPISVPEMHNAMMRLKVVYAGEIALQQQGLLRAYAAYHCAVAHMVLPFLPEKISASGYDLRAYLLGNEVAIFAPLHPAALSLLEEGSVVLIRKKSDQQLYMRSIFYDHFGKPYVAFFGGNKRHEDRMDMDDFATVEEQAHQIYLEEALGEVAPRIPIRLRHRLFTIVYMLVGRVRQ